MSEPSNCFGSWMVFFCYTLFMSESLIKPNLTWEELRLKVEAFSNRLNDSLKELDIFEKCADLEIDHICVRLKNESDVNGLKIQLAEVGQIISSVQVNGREISIIELNQPLQLGLWQTKGVELPYPKPNHRYTDGWEHVEFVLTGTENTMDGVRKAFTNKFPNLDLQKLEKEYGYSEDEPHAEGDQIPNPTIALKVNGVGIKFHANPIQVVVGHVK